jgi:hypothetical protein
MIGLSHLHIVIPAKAGIRFDFVFLHGAPEQNGFRLSPE